ncbi:uncharacterized protein [Triticum aestivum]|uniref:uncharacterized protein n=1 Tax=Triticum aestivum TaxID=4565 RepID=UPI001D02EAA9|nr:uncharacterized protein LOC123076980 [Triticum aestivum]
MSEEEGSASSTLGTTIMWPAIEARMRRGSSYKPVAANQQLANDMRTTINCHKLVPLLVNCSIFIGLMPKIGLLPINWFAKWMHQLVLSVPTSTGGCWLSVRAVLLHRSLILFVDEFCACHRRQEIALIGSSSDLPCCFMCSKDHLSLQVRLLH